MLLPFRILKSNKYNTIFIDLSFSLSFALFATEFGLFLCESDIALDSLYVVVHPSEQVVVGLVCLWPALVDQALGWSLAQVLRLLQHRSNVLFPAIFSKVRTDRV